MRASVFIFVVAALRTTVIGQGPTRPVVPTAAEVDEIYPDIEALSPSAQSSPR